MMWRDVIQLVDLTVGDNEIGDAVTQPTPREVYANQKSVRQSEFYQAMATGLQPELMFEVRSIDYQGEKQLIYNGKTYSIIRTYDRNGEIVELVCSGLVGD